MRDRQLNTWKFNRPLTLDIAAGLSRYAHKFGRPPVQVVVHETEYAGEVVEGVDLKTTDKRAHRGIVVVV
jgi:hypothetical protein